MDDINIDQFEEYLKTVSFPAQKKEVLWYMNRKTAPRELIEVINDIPEGNYTESELKEKLNEIIQQQQETGPR